MQLVGSTNSFIRKPFLRRSVIHGIIAALLLTACKNDLNNGTICLYDMESYDYSCGIEYDHPAYYLEPGQQSDLDDTYVEEIRICCKPL